VPEEIGEVEFEDLDQRFRDFLFQNIGMLVVKSDSGGHVAIQGPYSSFTVSPKVKYAASSA
jgi:hypothetical protein